MSDIVAPILEWLNAHPNLSGLVTFLISASESVAIIGTIIPGSIMMTAIGTLAGAGVIPLWPTIFWAILGAIAGDGVSYWLGYYYKDRLVNIWPFKTHPNLLINGERFVHKYGRMSVFIGRFVGPVRALVPLVAGMLGMRPSHFMVANVTSAIGWAPAYMLPGIMLGAASLELPPDIALHVILVTLLIVFFIMMCMWFTYKLYQLIRDKMLRLEAHTWQQLQQSRLLSPLTHLLKHHDDVPAGQLSLFFFFILFSCLFVALCLYVSFNAPENILANDAIFHLFRGIQFPTLTNIMLFITLFGQKEVVLPVIVAVFVWLTYKRHWRTAIHSLILLVFASSSVHFIKHFLAIPRPWGILQNEISPSFSMPSGHTTLATTLFLGLAFLVSQNFPRVVRCLCYMIAISIALSVGISRLYLGAHWFTDVLSAWILSAAILIATIISYQRGPKDNVNAMHIIFITLIAFIGSISFFHHTKWQTTQALYQELSWPHATLSMNQWWEKNNNLPAYRVSLFGFPSQKINVAWVGNINEIRAALENAGWSKPPPRDWISTLHRISGVGSGQFLQLVSPQYLDKTPTLILTRATHHGKKLLVIRLWNSNRSIKETSAAIYVGVVAVVPHSYSWLFKNHEKNLDINIKNIFPEENLADQWQWKVLTLQLFPDHTHIGNQPILLIRPLNLSKK